MPRSLIVANWKMYGNHSHVSAWLQELSSLLIQQHASQSIDWVACLSPVFFHLAKHFVPNTPLILGAQNLNHNAPGAFTGEVSMEVAQEYGCRYVLVGHSERRMLCAEQNALIAQKFQAALDNGLIPILCIGEKKEAHDSGNTFSVLQEQLSLIIPLLSTYNTPDFVIAYEPIWAIGTGITPSSELVQKVHKQLRIYIEQKLSHAAIQKMRIIYGGSVSSKNAPNFLACPDVDGLLIGRAALQAEEYMRIGLCMHLL